MKKILFALALPVSLFIYSCGDAASEEEDPLKDMHAVNLVVFDDSLQMYVSNTLDGTVSAAENSNGAVELKVGEKFQLEVSQEAGDIALVKSDIDGHEFLKLQKYIIDEPTLLFWEAKAPDMTTSEFHFYAIITVNGLPYVVSDVKNGEPHTQEFVQLMVNAAKTLRAKNAPAKTEQPST
jgi:hypothetical protein